MPPRIPSATLAAALLLGGLAACSNSYSNKWRLQVSEGANSDGVITLEFSPKGSEAFNVEISVDDGTSENAVSRTIARTLEDELPSDEFDVEVDDGEDILIKKKLASASFGLRVVSNTANAVRINLDRE